MEKLILKKNRLALLGLLLVINGRAQQTAQTFMLPSHYLLYLPEGYDKDTVKKWPLIVFLHGSGQSGDNLDDIKVTGLPRLLEQGKKLPFIIASPQATSAVVGFQVEVLRGLLNDLKKKYRVDDDRVYLTGLSMGGFSTWDFAESHPEEFAAIAPIASGGPLDRIFALRHVPVWCFHGAKDQAVPLHDSQQMVDSLKKYSGDVRLTVYPNANHNSWDTTYSNDSLYRWFLSQKKYTYTQAPIPSDLLKEYAGIYVSRIGADTMRIGNNKLLSTIRTYTTEYLPSSDSSFFNIYDKEVTVEIVFFKDSHGKPLGFWCYDPLNKNLFSRVDSGEKRRK
jgi:predicted esterase